MLVAPYDMSSAEQAIHQLPQNVHLIFRKLKFADFLQSLIIPSQRQKVYLHINIYLFPYTNSIPQTFREGVVGIGEISDSGGGRRKAVRRGLKWVGRGMCKSLLTPGGSGRR